MDPAEYKLLCAVFQGNVELVRQLLNEGAEKSLQWNLSTCLLEASMNNAKQIVELLLKHAGADVNGVSDSTLCTPLYIAASKGHKDIVVFLLSHGADVNYKDQSSETSLDIAVYRGHLEIAELLLKHGADVNTKSDMWGTPLHIAASHGHKDIVELLLLHGADINAELADNRNPLSMATTSNHLRITQIFARHIAMLNSISIDVSSRNMQLIDGSLRGYYDKCVDEIKALQSEMIMTNLALFDFIKKNVNNLVSYANAEKVARVVESKYYFDKFPIYASIIENRLVKVAERKCLFDRSEAGLADFFVDLKLPIVVIRQIFLYLNQTDFENLTAAVGTPPA